MAIEVDTWFRPIGNWVKLLDINALEKIWIYLCGEKEETRADENFENAVKEFRRLAKLRREDKTNNVVIFMKAVSKPRIEKQYLFPK